MEQGIYDSILKVEDTLWWYRGLHELVIKSIDKHGLPIPLKVLDAGCGTGKMMELVGHHGEVEGIDHSEEAIRIGFKRGLTNLHQADLNTWNPKGKLYDVIICLDLLYHKGIKDDIEMINKFHQALNTDGILILNLPAFKMLTRPFDKSVHTARRYNKLPLVAEMQNIGFHIIMVSYRLPLLFLVILTKKAFGRLLGSSASDSDLDSPTSWINAILLGLNRLENRIILAGIGMPFGSSLFVVSQKKD